MLKSKHTCATGYSYCGLSVFDSVVAAVSLQKSPAASDAFWALHPSLGSLSFKHFLSLAIQQLRPAESSSQ
jgi:hypothetical protein